MKAFHVFYSMCLAAPSVFSFSLALSARDTAIRTVYEFPNETWVENIAVRKSGKLLVTLITSPELWQVDPASHQAELVHHFPDALSVLGIAEVERDIFAVAVGNWSDTTLQSVPGSWSIWSVDMRSEGNATVHKVTDIPEANFLNGMTTLPTIARTIMVGDAGLGVIYRVNVGTGEYTTTISNEPALQPNASAAALLGVNGIHFWEGFLYFVNSFKLPFFGRFPLTPSGSAAGPVEIIAKNATYPTNLGGYADDFALDAEGNAWITTDPTGQIVKVAVLDGRQTVVAGGVNESIVAGNTAAAFGRTSADREVLYVTTNGGIPYPPPSGIVGGKVVALDTRYL